MKLIKLAMILVAVLAVAGHAWNERRRLGVIRGLPGRKARDYYEATRERNQLAMVVLTALLATAAIGALVYVLVYPGQAGAR